MPEGDFDRFKSSVTKVDEFLVSNLHPEDDILKKVHENTRDAGLPPISIAPTQAQVYKLLIHSIGAKEVLEFGTLGGYSAINFARAVGKDGHVTTLDISERSAEVSHKNFKLAQVDNQVDLILGNALDSAKKLLEDGRKFDFILLDADKQNNHNYAKLALDLLRPGGILSMDNLVLGGSIVDGDSDSKSAKAHRELVKYLGKDDRVDSVGVQTVGKHGWNGYIIARLK